jgi:hypothetical protein
VCGAQAAEWPMSNAGSPSSNRTLAAALLLSRPARVSRKCWLASRRELGEQGLCRLHVKRIQTFREPVIDLGKEIAGLSSLALPGP